MTGAGDNERITVEIRRSAWLGEQHGGSCTQHYCWLLAIFLPLGLESIRTQQRHSMS